MIVEAIAQRRFAIVPVRGWMGSWWQRQIVVRTAGPGRAVTGGKAISSHNAPTPVIHQGFA